MAYNEHTWITLSTMSKALFDANVRDNGRYFKGRDGAVTIEDWQTVLGLGLTDATELTIAAGVITATQGYHKVDTAADAASDDLDTINGGTAGYILVLRAEDGARTVVVKDGTGNILLPLGDCSIDDAEKLIMLLYDGANWREIARSGQGSGIDHGALTGLADDDHTQYILHSLATAADDFLVASGAGVYIKKTLAEVKTLLAIAADIATHAALNTGVHSVGGNFVAESSVDALDLASHKTRHEIAGADEISLNDLKGRAWFAIPLGKKFFAEDWKNIDVWTENADGGTYTLIVPGYMTLATGAVINKRETLYTGAVFAHPQHGQARFIIPIKSGTVWTDCEVRIYLVDNDEQLAPLIDTEKHGGFKIINGAMYSSHCDGTNAEVTTDLSVSMASQYAVALIELYGTGTAIRFYVDDVLKATHDTNLPADWSYHLVMEIKNQIAADRHLRVYSLYGLLYV